MSRVERAHSLNAARQQLPLPALPSNSEDQADTHPSSSSFNGLFSFRRALKEIKAKSPKGQEKGRPTSTTSSGHDLLQIGPVTVPRDSLILNELNCQRRRYFMSHQSRGIAIIINNKKFDRSLKLSDRLGTDVDAKALEEIFLNLGFTRGNVHRYDDVGHRDMKRLMDHYGRDTNYENMDCFFCVILSHGKDGGVIFGYDGKTTLDHLLEPFKKELHPTLIGKPKVFLVQACRGEQFEEGVQMVGTVEEDGPSVQRIPLEADFLYAYSTVPGYFSWRNASKGSWFIESLARNIKKYRGNEEMDLARLLTYVNYDVAYEYQSNVPQNEKMHSKKQMPSIVSMLTKELHF